MNILADNILGQQMIIYALKFLIRAFYDKYGRLVDLQLLSNLKILWNFLHFKHTTN